MAVLLETSLGDLVVDLALDDAPALCENFLALCTAKYYNDCVFFRVERGLLVLVPDPARDQIDLSATKFDADDAVLEQRGPATVAVFSGKKGFEIRFVDMDRDALAAQWDDVVL